MYLLNGKIILDHVHITFLQEQIDAAVKQLVALKAEFKQLTGQDYKADMAPPTTSSHPASLSDSSPASLYSRVSDQGEVVRKLKTNKVPKVSQLLQLRL